MIINKFLHEKYKESFQTYKHYYDDNTFCVFDYKILKNNKNSVIWVHGFNDYFYHYHISNIFLDKGYNFFAISLRRYRDIKKQFYVDDYREYIEDIENLLDFICLNYKSEKTILYGHSMGGLVSSFFCNQSKQKNKISALILNSPFFDFNEDFLNKFLIYYIIYYLGFVFPEFKVRKKHENKNLYSKEIINRFYFDSKLKLIDKPIIYSGWITTILQYQQFIQNNFLDLNIPILVLHSDKTIYNKTESNGDSVLNVEDIRRYSMNLGKNLKIYEIKDAIHDVFSSKEIPLKNAINILSSWINSI